MLEEPILYSLWGLRKFFLGITPSSLNGFGWNLEYNCGSRVHTRIKIAPRVPPNSTKTHFVFFVSPIQHGLSDTYPVLISTVFETTGMNLCARAYTCDKFPNFCIGVLQDPKNCPQKHYFGWGACYQHTPEITHFGQSISFRGLVDRHLKGVPFLCEFWWQMYSLGAMTTGRRAFHWHCKHDIIFGDFRKYKKYGVENNRG